MSRRNRSIASLVLGTACLSAALPGCAVWEKAKSDPTVATVIGVGAGALAGYALSGKHKTRGVLIGAALGGIAGYVLQSSYGSSASPEQKADPNFPKAQESYDKGTAHLDAAKQKSDEAREAEATDPARAEQLKKEAGAHLEAAEIDLTKSTQLAPEVEEGWIKKGDVALAAGDNREAKRCYEEALRCNPGSSVAKSRLAEVA